MAIGKLQNRKEIELLQEVECPQESLREVEQDCLTDARKILSRSMNIHHNKAKNATIERILPPAKLHHHLQPTAVATTAKT